jgi:hypothetical protein
MLSGYHLIRVFTLRLLSIYQWLFEITNGRFTWFLGKPVLLLRTNVPDSGSWRTTTTAIGTIGIRRRRSGRFR